MCRPASAASREPDQQRHVCAGELEQPRSAGTDAGEPERAGRPVRRPEPRGCGVGGAGGVSNVFSSLGGGANANSLIGRAGSGLASLAGYNPFPSSYGG